MKYIYTTQKLNRLLVALALAAAVPAHAGPVGPLTTFTAGTPAKASDVNGNFTTIVTTVNANDTRLTTVETTKQNIVSGTCPAGSAIRAIAANGTVTCQNSGGTAGVVTVTSAAGVPISSGTVTDLSFVTGAVGRFATSGSDFLTVPITLPQGATITAFSFSCIRNSASGCSAFLWRDDNINMAFVSIAAQAATVQTNTTTTIASPVADNQFGYMVFMTVSGGSTILPVRATVSYTLP